MFYTASNAWSFGHGDSKDLGIYY